MENIIFLDTETTEIENPTMIQLSFINNNWLIWSYFFKTDKIISIESMSIHHITPKILEKKWINLDEEIIGEINILLQNSWIVAHNADFDKRVLEYNGIFTKNEQWIDTYPIAYEVYQEPWIKHNLQYLRYYLWLEFEEEINPHDALSDVIVLKKVFEKMREKFGTIEEMKEMSDHGIILRECNFNKHKGRTWKEVAEIDLPYLNWLLWEEMKKKECDRNNPLVNTINFYLK